MNNKYPKFFTKITNFDDFPGSPIGDVVIWKVLKDGQVWMKVGNRPFFLELAWTERYLNLYKKSIKKIERREAVLLL